MGVYQHVLMSQQNFKNDVIGKNFWDILMTSLKKFLAYWACINVIYDVIDHMTIKINMKNK